MCLHTPSSPPAQLVRHVSCVLCFLQEVRPPTGAVSLSMKYWTLFSTHWHPRCGFEEQQEEEGDSRANPGEAKVIIRMGFS